MRGVQNLDKYFKQHEFIIYTGRFGGEKTLSGDVLRFKREVHEKDGGEFHPTPKPVNLIVKLLKDNLDKQNILDLFSGSGSTLIACEREERNSFNMELSGEYIDYTIKRFYDHTINCNITLLRKGVEYSMEYIIKKLELNMGFLKGKQTNQFRLF